VVGLMGLLLGFGLLLGVPMLAVVALAAVVGFVLSTFAEQIGTPGKIFYIVVNVLTTMFLIYFVARLWNIDERGHAVWAAVATACGFVIAAIYDFVHIPGDDSEHTIFYIFALSTWGLQMFTYYRAYRAFDAHNKRVDAEAAGVGASVTARP